MTSHPSPALPGLKDVQVHASDWAGSGKPHVPWAKVWGTSPVPSAIPVKHVLQPRKPYVSKSPKSGRFGVAALQAMLLIVKDKACSSDFHGTLSVAHGLGWAH